MNWSTLLSDQRIDGKKQGFSPGRSPFEQDFDRIVFSYPFRRLQDKTQVHPLPEDDFVHTRLTHSLEVSSVGRSLGKVVGHHVLQRQPELADKYTAHDFASIVAAAALTHDIGNPPFGHSGEDAISEYFKFGEGQKYQSQVSEAEWADLTTFEGNAQGFRILSMTGMKLTFATLAAFTKYPRQALFPERDKARRSQKKYGFFQSEKDSFQQVAEATGLRSLGAYSWVRHPLVFLVEAADDICYHLIDLEDGWRLGLVNYDQTVELMAGVLKEQFDKSKLSRYDTANERIGVLRALAVGKLIEEAAELFLAHEKDILHGDYDISLVDDMPSTPVLKEIIKLSIDKIYRSQSVVQTEAAGFEVLPGLLHAFADAAMSEKSGSSKRQQAIRRLFPQEMSLALADSELSAYHTLQTCVDFVSGLTDRHAISLYRKIKGISLPNA